MFRKIILLLLSSFFILSCSMISQNYKHFIGARESFVKIEIVAHDKECIYEQCPESFVLISGSGSVVTVKGKKFVLTAAHVCEDLTTKIINEAKQYNLTTLLMATDLQLNTYVLTTKKIDHSLDLCLLTSEQSLSPPGLTLSVKKPEMGQKVINIAAPAGIFMKELVPIVEGRYSGLAWGSAAYTIPAMGGSSGSPIVDLSGRLVGVLHSVHKSFPFFSLSPSFSDLWDFLGK